MGKKIFKKLAFSGLAVCIGALALLGCACTPATSATQGTHGASSGTDGGASRPAGTNTSPFGLNPATDPTVYTTSTGLEIKYANELSNSNLAGYTYFTMGEYEGTPINWVIIGYDPSVSGYVGEFSGESIGQGGLIQGEHNVNSTLDNSPMGNAIRKEFFAISNQAVENEEIGDGCVLCLSEDVIGSALAHDPTRYSSSNLRTYINNLYSTMFNDFEKTLIIPQTLKTRYWNWAEDTQVTDSLFPLATGWYFTGSGHLYSSSGAEQNFCAEDYMGSTTDISAPLLSASANFWWRSTAPANYNYRCAFFVTAGGNFGAYNPNATFYVRPAFVMKLW